MQHDHTTGATSSAQAQDESQPTSTQKSVTVAVLGAHGDAGSAIVRAVADAGHRVVAVSRSGLPGPATPNSASSTPADLLDTEATIASCAGADVVVCAAQPGYARWSAELGQIVDNAIAAARRHDARLVMMDNLYMYAPASGTITEASPEHAQDAKGQLRRDLAERVLAAHDRGEIRAVLARQSDFYGPGARNSVVWMAGIRNALQGRKMRAFFDADQPHTFGYLPDTAAALRLMIDDPSGDGKAWILPAAEAISQRQLFGLVNECLATPVGIGTLPAAAVRAAGLFNRQIRESLSVRCQFDEPWVTDGSAFQRHYGDLGVTSHSDAIKATLEWECANA